MLPVLYLASALLFCFLSQQCCHLLFRNLAITSNRAGLGSSKQKRQQEEKVEVGGESIFNTFFSCAATL